MTDGNCADIVSAMALFKKDRERSVREPLPPAGDPAPREVEMLDRDRGTMRGEDGDTLSAFLGKGTRVTGTLTFEGPTRIEGYVEGEVSAQNTLVIGENAVVNARVKGSTIVVHGTVTGDIAAEVRLELKAPSKVIGDISTPSLVIHDGAVLEGRCSMRASESVADTAKLPTTLAPVVPATQMVPTAQLKVG